MPIMIHVYVFLLIGIENAMVKFLELSRKTEAFFLRKRMLVAFQKPELVISEVSKLISFSPCCIYGDYLILSHDAAS